MPTSTSDDDDPEEEVATVTDDPTGPIWCASPCEPADAQAFVTRAVAVVRAGRLPCPNCGEPLDPRGHFCVRRNGYAN